MATGFGTGAQNLSSGLQGLNTKDQDNLSGALLGDTDKSFNVKNSISNNLGGFGRSVLGYAVPALEPALNVYGAVNTLGDLSKNYNTNKIANNLTNTNSFWGGFSNSGLSNLASEIDGGLGKHDYSDFGDDMRDGKVSQSEINEALGQDWNDVKNNLNIDPLAKEDTSNINLSGIGTGVGATGDLGGAKGAGYKGSVGGIFGIGKADGVNEAGPTGLGNTEQTGAQTSVTDTTAGKDMSNTFSDDAGASSDSGGTHCCTASMIRGEITLTEVKKLRVWHRKQSKVWQEGYDVWGKIIADLLISKYDWCANRAKEFYDYKIHNKITSGAILSSIVIYTGSYICGSYKVLKEKINAIKEVHTERPLR